MTNYARLVLPVEVADELLADRLAVRPVGTRGGGFAEAVQITVDWINTGAALVSVVLAANSCRKMAQAILRHRTNDTSQAQLTITVGNHTESMKVDLDAPGAEDQLFDFFVDQLNVA